MIQIARRSWFLFSLISALVIALLILAFLEYRWAGIVSEASREQMQTRLRAATAEIQTQFNAEIGEVAAALNPALANSSPEFVGYAREFPLWRSKARYPDLVGNVSVFSFTSRGIRVLRWDPLSAGFVPSQDAVIPASLAFIFAGHQVKSTPFMVMTPQNTPLLIEAARSGDERKFVVAELSLETFKRRVFPDIVRRALGDVHSTEFQFGVLNGRHPGTLVYRSDASLSLASFAQADEKIPLAGEDDAPSVAPAAGPVWMLVAKHRDGSLAAAAAEARRRWLVINFAVLAVLALGLVTIVTFILRAQALLRLQIEFVAGVSHELRTPLSVIGSAADNLAEGVVRSDKDVQEYGSLIRTECRRLSNLIEQTLRFSANKADVRPRDIQFFRIADVIDRALGAAITATAGSSFTLEKIVDANLPMVRADPDLLSECILNLISNALKYGGEAQWLGIRAHTVETGHGTGVQITVEDHGIGISSAELPHIFDPFYRGQTARSTQIRGTGLGLSLAREAASSIGARITVTSAVGKGSAFTLHIPPAYMNSSTVPVEALVES